MLTSAMTNIQTSALSTLAALATSSELTASPVATKQTPANVNGNVKAPTNTVNTDQSGSKTKVPPGFCQDFSVILSVLTT